MQAAAEAGRRRLYSRTGDDISAAFPDLVDALDFDGALDGELLVRRAEDGGIAPFADLQQRLNRKTVHARRTCAATRRTCAPTTCCSSGTATCGRCPSPSAAPRWRRWPPGSTPRASTSRR